MRRVLSRVPFIPSLMTLGNAFCGFLAIVKITDAALLFATMHGDPGLAHAVALKIEAAGLLILLAMVFDGLDGKVARLTDQATEFGAQLDSLADALTFGLAPAVLAKFLVDMHANAQYLGDELTRHPKLYYLCAALYALAAVMRLARFNVETPGLDERSHREFVGLPSPAAAMLLTSMVVFWCSGQFHGDDSNGIIPWIWGDKAPYQVVIKALPWAMFAAGLLMVSRFPYPHVMYHLSRGRKSFPTLAIAVFVCFLAVLAWQEVLMALCAIYVVSGPVLGAWRLLFGNPPERDDDDEDEEEPEVIEEVIEDDDDSVPGPGSAHA